MAEHTGRDEKLREIANAMREWTKGDSDCFGRLSPTTRKIRAWADELAQMAILAVPDPLASDTGQGCEKCGADLDDSRIALCAPCGSALLATPLASSSETQGEPVRASGEPPPYDATKGQRVCPHCGKDCGGFCEPSDRRYADDE